MKKHWLQNPTCLEEASKTGQLGAVTLDHDDPRGVRGQKTKFKKVEEGLVDEAHAITAKDITFYDATG